MANEEASPPSISLGSIGSDSHNESTGKMRSVKFSDAAVVKVGYSDELLKDSSGEPLDAEFPTPGDYLSECPDCCYLLRSGSLLRPGSQQHTEYCLNLFVRPGNETSSMDRQEHLSELQEILRQSTDTLSGTLIDPSLSATAVDSSALTASTVIPADASEDIAGEGHHTDERDIDPPSIQSPHLPQDTDIRSQSAMESGRHTSIDVTSLDEPRNHSYKCPTCQKDFTHSRPDSFKRHIKEAHGPGTYPCPHPECTKSKKPFKRPDKLQRHLNTCKFEVQIRGTRSPS